MSVLPHGVGRRVLLRSFAVQASFNYRTLIGTGFAFVVAPAMRHLRGGPAAEVAPRAEVFNAHPYLVPLAAGAVLRLEADGVDAATVARFKSALRSSLGSLGDRLFWAGWRPATALLGIATLLLGAPWWAAILAFWLPFNALHLWVRGWGFRVGLDHGLGVAATLRSAPLSRWAEWAANAGALLAGLCAVLLVARPAAPPTWLALGVASVATGALLGRRVRGALEVMLPLVWMAALGFSLLLRI